MVLPFNVALYSGVSVAALFAAAGAADAYAVGGNAPEFVADFAGVLNSGTEYYRSGGSDTTFSSVFTHSGLVLPATMTDSDGSLKWAPHNVLLRSNEFDNSNWSSSNMTETGGQTDPDGGSSAYKLTPTVSSAVHSTFKTTPNSQLLTLTKYAVEVIAKADGYNFLSISMGDVTGGSPYVIFDLSDGTIDAQSAGASGSITPIGSGWYLCTVDDFTGSSAQEIFSVNSTSNPTVDQFGRQSFAGDGSSGVLVYQARSYRSDLGGMVNNPDRGDSYVPTTTAARFLPRRNNYIYNGTSWENAGILIEPAAATNLKTYSNVFSNASWPKFQVVESQNAVGPDGVSNSAWTITDDGGGGSGLNRVDTGALTVATSTAYTASIYAKADQLSWIQILAVGFTTPANGGCYFDLSSGAIGTVDTGITGRIENCGNGWCRCSISFTTDASDTTGNIRIYLADANNDNSTDRDGTSSVLMYGFQFEAGSVPTSYIPTSGTTVTRAAETLTVAGANLPYSATAMSFQQQGRMNFADDDGNPTLTFFDWRDVGAYLGQRIQTNGTNTGLLVGYSVLDQSFDVTDDYVPGINVSYNNASRHTNDLVQVAKQGSAHTADSDPTATPAVSSGTLRFGSNGSVGSPPFTVALFRAWGTDIGTSGIEEAST